MIALVIPGKPQGKQRARTLRSGRSYTPAPTADAERRVQQAWRDAGCPMLPDRTPLRLEVHATFERPASHYRKDGRLSAAGEWAGWLPVAKGDGDNVLKLVADALEGHAYANDAAIVAFVCTKCWGAPASTKVMLNVVSEGAS